MNISSIVKFNSALNFGALKNIQQPEKSNLKVSLNNSSGDVFTSSKDAKKEIETERHVVVTFDDVYIFDTPKKKANIKNNRYQLKKYN
jgi:hypothetical protein